MKHAPFLFRRRAPVTAAEQGPLPGAALDLSPEDAARLREFWPKFWTVLGRVPFAEDLAAAWYCWTDPVTPGRVKAVLAGALVYFVTPMDMIPDFVAGIGFTDDAAVLAMAIGVAGAHIKRRHRQAARVLLRRDPA